MKKGINLKLVEKRTGGNSKKTLVSAGIFFSIIVFIALLLIFYKLYLGTILIDLSDKEKELGTSILKHDTKKAKLFDLHKRLEDISAIINKRSKIVDKVIYVSGIIPPDSTVRSLSAEQNTVDYLIASDSLGSLNELLEKKIYDLTKDQSRKAKIIELKSFSLDVENSIYELNFSIVF